MSSAAQIEANRQNAQKSTGPRTPEGKARVAANAITHGLLCRKAFIDGEDVGLFNEHCLALRESLAPVGAVEEMLADRVAAQSWRLRRATGMEGLFLHRELGQHGLLEDEFANGAAHRAALAARIEGRQLPPQDEERRKTRGRAWHNFFIIGSVKDLDILRRYERSIDQSLRQAMRDLRDLQDERRQAAPVELPRGKALVEAIQRDPEASKLMRQFARDVYEEARRAALVELAAARNGAGAVAGAVACPASGQATSAPPSARERGLRQTAPQTTAPRPIDGAQVAKGQVVTKAAPSAGSSRETKPISTAELAAAQGFPGEKTAREELEELLAAAAGAM